MSGQHNYAGPVEMVQLLWFWPEQFSEIKSKFHFYKKQVINKNASVIFALVSLIIVSYSR